MSKPGETNYSDEHEGEPVARSVTLPTWRFWLLYFIAWEAWACFFGVYFYIQHPQRVTLVLWNEIATNSVFWLSWAALVPLARSVVIDRIPFGRFPVAVRVVIHIALSLVVVLLQVLVVFLGTLAIVWGRGECGLWEAAQAVNLVEMVFSWRIPIGLVAYWGLFSFFTAVALRQELLKGKIRALTLENALTDQKLESIRARLNPHFLFNALHAVVTQISDQKYEAAKQVAIGLSDLLRSSVESSSQQFTPLRKELTVARHYLDIEKVRFGDKLQISMEIDPAAEDCLVPTFVLQPLLENAIKHGTSHKGDHSTIDVIASCSRDSLTIIIRDSGRTDGETALPPMGQGLKLTRERLRLLYGEFAHVEVRPLPEHGHETILKVPVKLSPTSAEK